MDRSVPLKHICACSSVRTRCMGADAASAIFLHRMHLSDAVPQGTCRVTVSSTQGQSHLSDSATGPQVGNCTISPCRALPVMPSCHTDSDHQHFFLWTRRPTKHRNPNRTGQRPLTPAPLAAAAAPAQAAPAAYDINSHTKEHLTIGTIGHVDHGKTTLTAAISKVKCWFCHPADATREDRKTVAGACTAVMH